jgi:signal peptidase II
MYPLFYLLSAVIVVDQLTKAAARRITHTIVVIPKFFSFVNISNTGASFGLFKDMNAALLGIGIIVVIGLIYFIMTDNLNKRNIVLLSLVTGGAVSNLIDRVLFGAVTDFIYFSFWPAFNIADSAITVGVVLLVVLQLKNKYRH